MHYIQATSGAFAAIKRDGSVVPWGCTSFGAKADAMREHLSKLSQVP